MALEGVIGRATMGYQLCRCPCFISPSGTSLPIGPTKVKPPSSKSESSIVGANLQWLFFWLILDSWRMVKMLMIQQGSCLNLIWDYTNRFFHVLLFLSRRQFLCARCTMKRRMALWESQMVSVRLTLRFMVEAHG